MPQNNSARIAEIREVLRTGVSRHTVDGFLVEYDLDALRRELRDLEADDYTARHRRPRISSINLDAGP